MIGCDTEKASGCFSNGDLTDYIKLAGIGGDNTGFEIGNTQTGKEFQVIDGSGQDSDLRVRFPLALVRIRI
jgi:hypothetical protein